MNINNNAVDVSCYLSKASTDECNDIAFDSGNFKIEDIVKMLVSLVKKMVDVIRKFNEKLQGLLFKMDVNILNGKMDSIDNMFMSSMLKSGGGIMAAVIPEVSSSLFFDEGDAQSLDASKKLSGSILGNAFSIAADYYSSLSQKESAIVEYQTKAAQSFVKSSDDLMPKARESMRVIIECEKALIQIAIQANSDIAKRI